MSDGFCSGVAPITNIRCVLSRPRGAVPILPAPLKKYPAAEGEVGDVTVSMLLPDNLALFSTTGPSVLVQLACVRR
jgi:hypothetical protein